MIPLGIMGHLLSIVVFTRRSLRKNPCAMYLLAATIFGLISTCFTLPMRLIQSGYIGLDPTIHSIFMCKMIWFLLYSIRLLCFWFIVLACLDRYLCSSPSAKIRAWSSTCVASQIIPLTILIVFLSYIHIPINFKININAITHKPVCHAGGPPGSYRKVLSFFNLLVFGLTPPLCMLIFGIFTLRHTHRKHGFHRILCTNSKLPRLKTSERQLLRMLLTQVSVYSVSGLIFCIAFINISMNTNQQATVLETAQENLIIVIVGMISNTGPCLSFYLYTLSSGLFRKELKNFFDLFVGNKTQWFNDYMLTTSIGYTTKQQPE